MIPFISFVVLLAITLCCVILIVDLEFIAHIFNLSQSTSKGKLLHMKYKNLTNIFSFLLFSDFVLLNTIVIACHLLLKVPLRLPFAIL